MSLYVKGESDKETDRSDLAGECECVCVCCDWAVLAPQGLLYV